MKPDNIPDGAWARIMTDCPVCHRDIRINTDGALDPHSHIHTGRMCPASGYTVEDAKRLFVTTEGTAAMSEDAHGPDYMPDIQLQTCPSCKKRVTVEEWSDGEGICAGCSAAIGELPA